MAAKLAFRNMPVRDFDTADLQREPSDKRNIIWKASPLPRECRLGPSRRPGGQMAKSPRDDQELLRQLARGNEAAFSACYERYQGPIYRFACHMSGNPASAEEVTQEVFLRLIHEPQKYDPRKGSLAGYLFGIARNLVRRQIEADRLDLPLGDELLDGDDTGLASEPDLLLELDRREKLECLRKSLLALPEVYREALVLCDMEEMTYPEVAAILQCPPGTVASRLHRARVMLKLRLKEMGCVR